MLAGLGYSRVLLPVWRQARTRCQPDSHPHSEAHSIACSDSYQASGCNRGADTHSDCRIQANAHGSVALEPNRCQRARRTQHSFSTDPY